MLVTPKCKVVSCGSSVASSFFTIRGADKHEIQTGTQLVKANDELKIRLLENGGFCGVITPRDNS